MQPKSLNQRSYLDAIEKYDMVFGIGPAGTGKTYLAVAMGVSFLLSKKVNRIILARPAVGQRRKAVSDQRYLLVGNGPAVAVKLARQVDWL